MSFAKLHILLNSRPTCFWWFEQIPQFGSYIKRAFSVFGTYFLYLFEKPFLCLVFLARIEKELTFFSIINTLYAKVVFALFWPLGNDLGYL